MKSILSLFLLFLTGHLYSQQDTLLLHSGDTLTGSVYAQNKYITKIYVDTAWFFIQNTEIIREYQPDFNQNRNRASLLPDSPEFYTIPAGEFLVIKTKRRLNTRFTKTGEIVECFLAQSILNWDREVILSKNTPLIARVKFARNGNAFRTAQLQLELVELHVNQKAIPISTTDNIRILDNYTSERILGSTATGSVIGAVFFNEWLRGALIGASVGTATSLIVENNNIIIPENSILEFMLNESVNIRTD